MPSTSEGKAISSRNATKHGLFTKDVVLPGLSEDPQGYQRLTEELTAEMAPRTLVERHYVEKIAAAFWILRRLRRWQAGLFADGTLTENERLDRLERALRHETALNRQVDTALKMLNKDVPQFYKSRPQEQALPGTGQSDLEHGADCENELEKEIKAWERKSQTRRDVAQSCQNEPTPASITPTPPVSGGAVRSNGAGSPSGSPRIGGRGESLSLTAAGRLVPARVDAARRLLFSA